ncbi:MAG: F0F1 ATP synthase subunit A [Deltaproteobacteria bacterium]|nr:F0F1 ATP synthase subunit A [Deltaproteobacteria bacterium]
MHSDAQKEAFTWLSMIPALEQFPSHVVMAVLVAVLILIAGAVATLKLKAAGDSTVPDGTLTYRNFFEIVAEKLYDLTEQVMGVHAAEEYFPLCATLFIFVFGCNIIGLIPGFVPPTENINVTLAAGVFVFLYYNFHGFRIHGIAYLKHFLGPVWYLAPLLLVVELMSHLFRPMTLALRLKGNIMGDHLVLETFHHLVPYVVPVIFYAMGVFVSFVQAFVFCLLTMVYISLSTSHDAH